MTAQRAERRVAAALLRVLAHSVRSRRPFAVFSLGARLLLAAQGTSAYRAIERAGKARLLAIYDPASVTPEMILADLREML